MVSVLWWYGRWECEVREAEERRRKEEGDGGEATDRRK
jgi:hypothetical protein